MDEVAKGWGCKEPKSLGPAKDVKVWVFFGTTPPLVLLLQVGKKQLKNKFIFMYIWDIWLQKYVFFLSKIFIHKIKTYYKNFFYTEQLRENQFNRQIFTPKFFWKYCQFVRFCFNFFNLLEAVKKLRVTVLQYVYHLTLTKKKRRVSTTSTGSQPSSRRASPGPSLSSNLHQAFRLETKTTLR